MANATNQTSSATSSSLRRNFLLAILGLLLIGLVYDFAVARPAVEKAYTMLTEKNDEFNAARKHQAMGEAETREVLGRKPSRTFQDGHMHVEVYSWRSGLPFRTHDLYVVYRPVLGKNFLVRLTKFVHESENSFQAIPPSAPNVADVERVVPANLPSDNAEEAGAEEADISEDDDATGSPSDRDDIEPSEALLDVTPPVTPSELAESAQDEK